MVKLVKVLLADNPVVCHYNHKIGLICMTSDTEKPCKDLSTGRIERGKY